jgi:hypothetical protein
MTTRRSTYARLVLKDDESLHVFYDDETVYVDGHPSFALLHRVFPTARIEACVNSRSWGGWQWVITLYDPK